MTRGPLSSDLGFIPFHPSIPSSSNPTTHDTAEYKQETPSLLTIQEEELIALGEEDRIMRKDAERRMNVPGRTRPGGVRQGRVRLHMSMNPYPHKMALGKWSSQHAAESCKRRSIQQGGQRGRPFVIPGDRGNKADDSGRGGGSSGSAEKIALLPAFDPSSTAGCSSRPEHNERGSHWGSIIIGEPSESSMELGVRATLPFALTCLMASYA